MKKRGILKALSSLLAFVLVLSLMMPFSVSASADQTKPFKPNTQSESIMQMKAAIAEQLNLANGGPKLHKDLQGLSGDEVVDVIVNLSEVPVGLQKGINELSGKKFSSAESLAVQKKVNVQQLDVKKEMKALEISYEEGFTYDTVLNGFSAKIKASDIQKLLQVQGVTLVEPDATVYAYEDVEASGQVEAAMNTSIDHLGIEALWAEGFEGQGIKVAVLDTGIDADHPEFEGIYKGGKNFVPHTGTDYTRPRADDDASETSPAERPNHRDEVNDSGRTFWTDHGTHVAGTIAAIGKNEYGVKGIAPKVDLYMYRVLGAYGSGSNAGVIAAIDYAVKQEMDVINLSLGGGVNTETASDSYAINNAMLAGTIAVVATGNSGPGRGSMGTPATARLGIAVGNTTNPELSAVKAEVTNGDFEFSKDVKFFFTPLGIDLKQELSEELGIVAIPNVGKESDYDGLDVEGKVVHVSRGEITFMDKIKFATEKGAKAIIIYNTKDHADGNDNPMSGVGGGEVFTVDIPSFNFSYNDGKAIKDGLENGEGKITFDVDNIVWTAGDEVNNSSSRGPSTPNFDIKPDVTAPGTNILSSVPMYKADYPDAEYDKAYDRFTGTSMAAPHIAGIVALIKQANPEWSPFDVKVALSNTAKILDTDKYDVFAQGAGRVNAYAAAHPEILAYAIDEALLVETGEVVENLKGTVTFGPQSLEEGDISVEKQILVKDVAGNGGKYTVTVDYTKEFGDAEITIDNPTFTLDGEMMLTVTLTASAASTKAGDEILGYIYITGGDTTISLPFAADFGGEVAIEIQDMRITETDLSFNGDGVKDEAMLYFTITGDVGENYLEIWDMMNPEGGVFEDGYIGYLHAGGALKAGSYELAIKGSYRPWDGSPATTIPDGLYTIDYNALSASGKISDYVGPVVVKSTAGTIEGFVEGTTVTGQVDDAYIGYQEKLVSYGMGYDINTKLKASYVVSKDGVATDSGPITLEQDGTFTFELPEFDEENEILVIRYEDAAGNKAQSVVGGDLFVDDAQLTLYSGSEKQLKVTAKILQPDGTAVVNDVTEAAIYSSGDEKVVKVKEGLLRAVAFGETDITITYGDNGPVIVTVNVINSEVIVPSPEAPAPEEEKPEVETPEGEKPDGETPEGETPTVPDFKDTANTFAANEINALVAKGILQGKTETEFAPNAQITRAEFAVLLARALDLPLEEYEGKFGDVNTSKKWAFAGVEAAARAGIINGTANGSFNPDAPIKREEIAAMIIRAIEYQNKEKLAGLEAPANFGDHGSIGTFAIDSVYKAASLGVIQGNNGNFVPKNNATRAEAAVMLYRALEVLGLLD
ncbi:S8 family serine peptidase [Sporosarcina thermotolerans]|uniref:S8 family serine peptidase n=1 Tax=Sporosarcina thermotolerans TaxID=633404 RepID=A0AAW9A7M0_9BACL|nr:S8 family serine peptidase [Sporosarcina thermotolerans]MDW0116325.1 S8 family serine peptidase [Sporosarcina thermotolerans]WHT48293.1 S8 family serine peptidase [Sporosarcina thermotolerans]